MSGGVVMSRARNVRRAGIAHVVEVGQSPSADCFVPPKGSRSRHCADQRRDLDPGNVEKNRETKQQARGTDRRRTEGERESGDSQQSTMGPGRKRQ